MTGFYFIASALHLLSTLLNFLCLSVYGGRDLGINLQLLLKKNIAVQWFPSGGLFGHVFAFMKKWK